MNLKNYIPGSLGIESGGTRTSVCYFSGVGENLEKLELGPGNYRIAPRSTWDNYFRQIKNTFPQPSCIGLAVAGARNKKSHEHLNGILRRFFPSSPIRVSHDLESSFWSYGSLTKPRLVCISGTGSCCFSIKKNGEEIRVGGWGHILGDQGSGYAIGLELLKTLTSLSESSNPQMTLMEDVLSEFELPDWESMVDYTLECGKESIASLARICSEHATHGDNYCLSILENQARNLAGQAKQCLGQISTSGSKSIDLCVQGSLLKYSKEFRDFFISELKQFSNQLNIIEEEVPSYIGALHMATMAYSKEEARPPKTQQHSESERSGYFVPSLEDLGESPTELRNPASFKIDEMAIDDGIKLFLDQDRLIPDAIEPHIPELVVLIEKIFEAFNSGGRLFYAGAGTSGRLGILDASECPPTFRTHPDLIQGIIAGGTGAMFRAVEGAEDSFELGADSVLEHKMDHRDVIIGIAASGRTPFVWGHLKQAKAQGAHTVLLTFNPNLSVPEKHRPDQIIAIDVGPEILTGSTRLKSGTATKMVLNILTTLSMVQMGKVVENLMVDLNPSNEKLKERAIRILSQLTHEKFSHESYKTALMENDWEIKKALKALRGEQ